MTGKLYMDVFHALGSEIILLVTAFVVLSLDLVWLRSAELRARRQVVGLVTVVGLLTAVAPLWFQFGCEYRSLAGGTLMVTDLTAPFNFVIVGLTLLAAVMSIDYNIGKHVGEYFATLLFGAIGMMLLISSEELIAIFVALELTSLSLYILTAFHKGALRSQEAAVKYFMFGAISSAFLLFGLSYVYGATGATNLRQIAHAIHVSGAGPLLSVALLFVIVGFGFKVAVVPFHLWAPDAYEGAPTPVTAFIATGSKVASFFIVTKVLMVAFGDAAGSAYWGKWLKGWTLLVAVTAVLSMVLGNFAAIVQRNVKRLLAYSSIAHAGYIFIGLTAASATGATSVLFYVIVYALTNLGAFGVVAALAEKAGGDELENFNGMARRAPLLSLLMLIFVLSLAGIPPLGGFFGKCYLFVAAVGRDAQQFGLLWLVIIGILMSAVSLYYYLIVLKHFYVEAPKDAARIETPTYLNAALVCVALAVVGLGLFPQPILELLKALTGRL